MRTAEIRTNPIKRDWIAYETTRRRYLNAPRPSITPERNRALTHSLDIQIPFAHSINSGTELDFE
jgi:hypothetical protein